MLCKAYKYKVYVIFFIETVNWAGICGSLTHNVLKYFSGRYHSLTWSRSICFYSGSDRIKQHRASPINKIFCSKGLRTYSDFIIMIDVIIVMKLVNSAESKFSRFPASILLWLWILHCALFSHFPPNKKIDSQWLKCQLISREKVGGRWREGLPVG